MFPKIARGLVAAALVGGVTAAPATAYADVPAQVIVLPEDLVQIVFDVVDSATGVATQTTCTPAVQPTWTIRDFGTYRTVDWNNLVNITCQGSVLPDYMWLYAIVNQRYGTGGSWSEIDRDGGSACQQSSCSETGLGGTTTTYGYQFRAVVLGYVHFPNGYTVNRPSPLCTDPDPGNTVRCQRASNPVG